MKQILKNKMMLLAVSILTLFAVYYGGDIAQAAPSYDIIETQDGYLYQEIEDLWYNNSTVIVEKDADRYFNGMAVGFDAENKQQPEADAMPDIILPVRADVDGTYYVWMRHYADTVSGGGQNAFHSLNGNNYTTLNLTATPEKAAWLNVTSVTLKAGETFEYRIRGRQKYGIALDCFVVTNDPSFTPTDLVTKPLEEGELIPGEEKILDAICFSVNSNNALDHGIKFRIDEENQKTAVYKSDDTIMVPLRFLTERLQGKIHYDDAANILTLTYGGKEYTGKIGESKMTDSEGNEIALSAPLAMRYERTFAPLDICQSVFGKEIFTSELGLVMLSNEKDAYQTDGSDDEIITSIITRIILDRPTGEEIISSLWSNYEAGEHPRLFANQEDFDKLRTQAAEDEYMKWFVDNMKQQVDAAEADKTFENLISEISKMTDDNTTFSTTCMDSVRDWVTSAACLYQVTGDAHYAELAWSLAEPVCQMYDWFGGGGFLCIGQMGVSMAIVYDWCYDYLQGVPGALELMEKAFMDNALQPGLDTYNGIMLTDPSGGYNTWTEATTNWNPVCNAGLISVSIVTTELYPEQAEELLGKAVRSLEAALKPYAPDGANPEGPAYWAYGTGFMVYCFAGLEKATGTDYGLACYPGVLETCYYRPYVHSMINHWDYPENTAYRHWNYHDTGRGVIGSGMYMWFATRLDDPYLAGMRLTELQRGTENVSFNDIVFYTEDNLDQNIQLPLDRYFKGIQTVFMRRDWNDPDGIYTGLHAGKSRINHSQLDTGNFILDAEGIRWIEDLGMDNYSLPGYFSSGNYGQRWSYYRARAEGHNTIVIDPGTNEDQKVSGDSPIIEYESTDDRVFAITDFRSCYQPKATSAKRGLMLGNNRTAVVVQDEITLADNYDVWWFAHTEVQDVEIAEDGRSAIMTQDGKRMYVEIVSDQEELKFGLMPAEKLPTSPEWNELERDNSTFQKLYIHGEQLREFNVAVVFQTLEPGQDEPDYTYVYTALDQWGSSEDEDT